MSQIRVLYILYISFLSCEGGSSESVDDSDDDYNWETTDDIEYDSENVDDDAESFEEPDSAGS